MGSMNSLVEPLLTITEAARAKILEVRAAEPDPETLALWVEVSGESSGAYTYVMEFRADEAGEADVVLDQGELTVIVDADSALALAGAVLDFSGTGMVMQNPNRPAPPAPWGGKVPDLSGDVAQRVLAVLEAEVNPAIAAHGGHADLIAVEDGIAYVQMAGGCQGCGMAAATLAQGIEVSIVDNVPEITKVVDVTDHQSGANPYYAGAH